LEVSIQRIKGNRKLSGATVDLQEVKGTRRTKFFRGRGMEKIKIQGMSCQHCVMSVTKALGALPGIKNLKVDLVKGEAIFENSQNVPRASLRKAVEDAGYRVTDES
jgi:copper chaperone